jgi:hypothetical protein
VDHSGCFIEGTIVTVSSLPGQSTSTDSLWSNPSWLDEPSQETPWLAPERYASVATRTQLQVPIESVPIGARVPTKNPNRFEVDPQPEPDHATWFKVSITVERSDGGIVDAEIIRPRSWILASGLCAGRMLPLNLPELEVSGLALVTAIDDCPPIADGEGSVVTARFVTREVHVVASVDVLGADGTVETITGTTIHPVWSVDRQSWVPLAELADGETLQGLDGLAVVLSVSLSRVSQPVYNIEVHGEHVYQVGELGVVVHNAGSSIGGVVSKILPELKAPVKGGLGYPGSMVNINSIYLGAKAEAGLGKIIGWGVGARGAIARTASITKDELGKMGMTKDVATYWLNFYKNAKDLGRGATTAPERIKLMERILEILD